MSFRLLSVEQGSVQRTKSPILMNAPCTVSGEQISTSIYLFSYVQFLLCFFQSGFVAPIYIGIETDLVKSVQFVCVDMALFDTKSKAFYKM